MALTSVTNIFMQVPRVFAAIFSFSSARAARQLSVDN